MRHYWLSVLSILSAVRLTDLATPPAPLWGNIRVMHTWGTVPANWECLGPPPAATTIDLYIALKPNRENALIEALYQVSNPTHKKHVVLYHSSVQQVAELVAPHQDTLDLVHSWLEYHGVPSSSVSTSHGGGWLTITGVPVSQADGLLGASYQLYRHTGTNETEVILRTVGYALPAALHGHVQTVAPTTHFAPPRKPLQTQVKRSSEEITVKVNATSGERVGVLSRRDDPDVVKPDILRWLYKTEGYVPAAAHRNTLGILGFKGDFPNQADLSLFMFNFRADALAATFNVDLVNGGLCDPNLPGPEASVDIQYTEALAFPTPHIFYSAGGPIRWSPDTGEPAPGDGYLEWLRYLLKQPNIPATISISYGNPEPSLPPAYATAVCNLFAALGLRGASVLVGSGDDGVGRGDCMDNFGNDQFIPIFPASCPWVTSVGGTMGFVNEVAMPLSGGGFSRYFERPIYQDGAVPPFLEHLGIEYAGLYNPEGRGIPDIAAQAHKFKFAFKNEGYITSGTSCSTPTVAGIVSLLNDYRLSNYRSPLGFLNFWLYGRASTSLNDITSGTNPGCETDGFSAIVGWDPVTGLGTPDFVKLQKVILGGQVGGGSTQ
ncbi:subtilisin-like protein [Lactarius psammicola]|nr:subtilisin-like protein [Lactarius psammicola]